MNRIKYALIICSIFFSLSLKSQKAEETSLVKWLTIEKAEEQNKIQQRAILIDFYTDWCGWCKHMMKTTFSNPDIANYINTFFYPVRFNAESKDSLFFRGEKYYCKGKTHDFAVKMLDGKLTYPTIVFLNNDFKFKLIVPGYQDVKQIEPILIYSVEYIFNSTDVNDFIKNYNLAFYNDSLKADSVDIVWLKLDEAIAKTKVKPKKMIISFSTNWCNGCKTMFRSSFKNSKTTNFINENFYAVKMDPETSDTILFHDKKFYKDVNYSSFNNFFNYITAGRAIMPSTVFIDENMKLISSIPYYISPEALEIILHYFNENGYLSIKWEDYVKNWNENKQIKSK
jgi:thioredoxin-related protein